MEKINFKIFRILWQQLDDGRDCGADIINKRDIGLATDCDIPVIWLKNNLLGAKLVSFLLISNGRAEEFTFLSYNGKKDKHQRTIDRKFFGRVRSKNYIMPLIFSPEIISTTKCYNVELVAAYLTGKVVELQKSGVVWLLLKCIANRPNRKTDPVTSVRDYKSNSVRTIAGGLYGLGKNRKH